jgi:hypothetical protein
VGEREIKGHFKVFVLSNWEERDLELRGQVWGGSGFEQVRVGQGVEIGSLVLKPSSLRCLLNLPVETMNKH